MLIAVSMSHKHTLFEYRGGTKNNVNALPISSGTKMLFDLGITSFRTV